MTLALIVLIVFLSAWFDQSAKIKGDKATYRKRTITNVQLQDELNLKNIKKVIDDLEALPNANKLSGDTLLGAIESLYETYDVPDRRTPEQKAKNYSDFKATLARLRDDDDYPTNDTKLPLIERIWHYPHKAPDMSHLELLFGVPNTIVEHNDIEYKYDHRGIASNMFWTIPAKLVGDLQVLLTMKELDEAGYKYSWNRQESNWQRAEADAKKYKEHKDKYPWLYR